MVAEKRCWPHMRETGQLSVTAGIEAVLWCCYENGGGPKKLHDSTNENVGGWSCLSGVPTLW